MHILLIEDEERLAKALKKGLEIKGYAVDWIGESKRGRDRLIEYKDEYDLVLMDLMMPEMDGAEVTEAVRREGVSTPIIILTGRGETEHKIELLNKGADDYIVKPFSFEELLARINSVMRRPQETRAVVLTAGPLEMDVATRTVRKNGKELELTLKEFALLESFMREPNTVFTRETLFDHAWDFNSLSWSNVLDVHMKNLRRKLQNGNDETYIETVRGVGYRFSVPAAR